MFMVHHQAQEEATEAYMTMCMETEALWTLKCTEYWLIGNTDVHGPLKHTEHWCKQSAAVIRKPGQFYIANVIIVI